MIAHLKKLQNWFVCIVVVGGTILALFQYGFNRSLWLDEAFLAINIITKSTHELSQTLEYNTAAPFFYSLLLKLFGSILGYQDYVLRLPSFLAYLLGIYMLLTLARDRNIDASIQILLFVFIMVNPYFIRYSSELKQYMMDFLVATIYLYFLTRPNFFDGKKVIVVVAFVIFCFCSHAAIIWLISFLMINLIKNHKSVFKKQEIIFYLIGILGIALIYITQFSNNSNRDFQYQYCIKAGAFLPFQSGMGAVITFLIQKYKMIFFEMLPFFPRINFLSIGLLLMAITLLIIQKKYTLTLVFILPLLLHLFLSGIQKYPFEKKYVIYLVVIALFMVAVSLQFLIDNYKSNISKIATWALSLGFLIILLIYFRPHSIPVEVEEIKPILLQLEMAKKKDESLIVYYYTEPVLRYYTLSAGLLSGIKYRVIGNDIPEKYDSIFKSSNKKIWLLLSHIYPNQ